jgi:integrase
MRRDPVASVNKDGKGRWRVQFKVKKRHTLRLGRQISEKAAKEVGRHIDSIIESRKHGLPIPPDTENWLGRLANDLRVQLVQKEVIEDSGARGDSTLGGFLTDYIRTRSDVQPSTKTNYETAKRLLIRFFGDQRKLDSITPGEADEYRLWLGAEGKQAPNTVKRLCGRAKQFFRAALRRRLISENPFQDMKHLIVGASPRERIREIDAATAQRVLNACPNAHWRAIFALARYGGMRVPSEIVLLRWADIDWTNARILVTCQKTKGHEGKETRFTPLFPELRRELEAWRSEAPKGRDYVLKPAISPKTNLRTGLMKILKRAKIKPWPKLFQNLRSSRATELIDNGFPPHVVAEWLGHTVKVAVKHYWQTTDEHFRRAVQTERKEEPPTHGAA